VLHLEQDGGGPAERPRVAFRERSAAAAGRSSPVLGVHTSYRATPFPAPFATRAGAPSTTLLCCAGGEFMMKFSAIRQLLRRRELIVVAHP
jgi:hypothetical protein